MDKKHWTEKLVKLGACSEAVEWSKQYKTFQQAWDACGRIDWLTWLVYKKRGHKAVVRLACKYARLALPYTTNSVVLQTIKTIEAWLVGRATIEQVEAAGAAAGAAAVAAAGAAARATGAAARAATRAVYAAVEAAVEAARAATRAVYAAGAAAGAAAAVAEAASATAGIAAGIAVRKQYLAITKKVKITL